MGLPMHNHSDTEDSVVEHSESEKSYEEEEDDSEIIRAKWLYDGCKTLDEIIERLEGQIEYINKLKSENWELIDKVNDDYGFMRQKK